MTDLVDPKQYELADRYRSDSGSVFLSGVQALARLPFEQLRADRAAGISTAAFLSGYPGSPLGGFDREVASALALVRDLPVILRPAVNEELAASAVMGSQLVNQLGRSRYHGVLGLWYGKTPGLDRAGDAIRHAVFAGADPRGGAVALVGDDPSAKSSTLPSSSERTLEALGLPFLAPGSVADALVLGRHAIAMSRLSGAWVALRIVTAVADGTGTVRLDGAGFTSMVPDREIDGLVFHPAASGKLLAPFSQEMERELVECRLEIARRYGVVNALNPVTGAAPGGWLGIVAPGHTHTEVIEALTRLGLTSERALDAAGVRVLHVRMPFPLDRDTIRSFSAGLAEILVVEDKRPMLEPLVRDALYGRADPPLVVGKRDEFDRPLVPAHGALDADGLVDLLRARLERRLGPDRLTRPEPRSAKVLIPLSVNRSPHFCSGCPHNTSTKVPVGVVVGGGIGCSSIIALMPEDRIGELIGLTAMGNEGAPWIGMAPFVDLPHLVQYLGDGTYAHSGHLAIRATIAAGVDVTFKLLYNGAVSMTGGQHAEGVLSVPDLARSLLLEGATRVIVTTDEPGKYAPGELPAGVEQWGRDRILEAQTVLAAVPGTTILIHDQACAAEKRRARKRGVLPTPTAKVLIAERVCEGCGDCGATSNCLSVQPVDTPFGRKTRIDQTSCNLDLSCMDGDCPSFVTVLPSRRARRARRAPAAGAVGTSGSAPARGSAGATAPVPASFPPPPRLGERNCTIRMSGIGGTGVVTVSQVLGTAALLDGLHASGLDQTGLSQKAGPVVSDLRLSAEPVRGSNKAPQGAVDVELAFDLLVAAGPGHLLGSAAGRTIVVASTSIAPTGAMVNDPSLLAPSLEELRARIDDVSRPELNRYLDAASLSEGLLGDSAQANVLLVGVAVQLGAVPLAPSSVERAIELNGVAVDRNIDAFRWGRQWVVARDEVERAAGLGGGPAPESIDALVDRLAADLTDYQSPTYASRYRRTVQRVREAETRLGTTELTEAVARQLHKLMAYKDEYEVARLLLLPETRDAVEALGGRGATAIWHLHPPVLRSWGLDHKLGLGRWARPLLGGLRAGRRIRGRWFDPFGHAALRRTERAMVVEYEAVVARLADSLTAANHAEAVAIAGLPDRVRGYERLKEQRAAAYRAELARRLGRFAPSS